MGTVHKMRSPEAPGTLSWGVEVAGSGQETNWHVVQGLQAKQGEESRDACGLVVGGEPGGAPFCLSVQV